MPAVVKQRVHSLLQHPLFIANDDVGSLQLKQIFEAVVAVDDTPIQIVQIRRRKSPAFERHKRAQIRRDHRKHLEDHPFRPRPGVGEALNELQPFGEFLADLFAPGVAHRLLDLLVELREVALRQKGLDCFRAHAGYEILAVLLDRLAILGFR